MFRGGIGNVVLAPISEVLARLVVEITNTAVAAKDVLIEQESFRELGGYLEKIQPVLKELQDKNVRDTPPMRVSLESLNREINKAQELIELCASKGRIYLLINCRTLVKRVQDITNEVGRCLSLIPMASMNISVDSRETTARLLVDMQNAQFKAAAADEAIIEKIELGIRDQRTDRNFANDLLMQIARVVGVSPNALSLSQELEEFKKEREEAELKKNLAEAYQLEQIIALLSAADMSPGNRNGAGAFEPQKLARNWQYMSFYCPLTQSIMVDPVEIASGQTFERSAIQKWFEKGNDVCPVTAEKLQSFEMKPNYALRSSIEESKDRNVRSSIAAHARKLKSDDENEIQAALWELYRMSKESPRNRLWIAEGGLIPVMVNLLHSRQRATRVKALTALGSLAVENGNKESIMDAGALPLAVKSLSREVGERREAVGLLLELSKQQNICDRIGKVQGCILLLATLRSENASAAQDATTLLDSLSDNTQNVVQMAEANYFKPLANRLREGSEMDRVLMASALARMGLTDQGKATLAQEGAIGPLVRMISLGNLEAKAAALGALQNLSTLAETRQEMITAGLLQPMLKLLCSVTSSLVTLKEQAAATFANLATPPSPDERNEIMESEDTLTQLLSLLNLAGPEIQGHLLRALYGISAPEGAIEARNILRAAEAIQLLLPFCDNVDSSVRIHALKLLFCLSGDGAERQISEFLGQTTSTRTLVDIMSAPSFSDEEKAAAAGILGRLPSNDNQLIDRLVQAGAITATVGLMSRALERRLSLQKNVLNMLLENAAATLLHFTSSSREDLQRAAAEEGAIACLVELLSTSSGSSLAKSRAATALGLFSENSHKLSAPIARSRRILCFSQPTERRCVLHRGHCSVQGSFCILEADAIVPLVQCLEEESGEVQEAAAGALATVLQEKIWQQGVKVLADARGIRALVRVMTVGSSAQAKEKAVMMLEKVFRVDKYREEFGSSAKMPLIELTSRGSSAIKPVAARILAHLSVIHTQSSYF